MCSANLGGQALAKIAIDPMPSERPHHIVKKSFLCTLLFLIISFSAAAKEYDVVQAVKAVPGQYLVVLDEDFPGFARRNVPQTAKDLATLHGGTIRLIMNNAASLYSVEMTAAQADSLARDPRVLFVEENGYGDLSSLRTLPSGPQGPNWPYGALWNLDRIDQTSTTYDNRYYYCEKGANVIAYMPDTGIMASHIEFSNGNRIRPGVSFGGASNSTPTAPCNGQLQDNYRGGHGTSVASVLGGKDSGVAPAVTMVPIQILQCDATFVTTEAACWGLDWIRSPANPDRLYRPALVSMSFYLWTTNANVAALESVINGLVRDGTTTDGKVWKGIPVIASANNQGRNEEERLANGTYRYLARTSPARMAYSNAANFASPGRVISVGGTQYNDQRWVCPSYSGEPCLEPGSNFGTTVDIWAPAHNIRSAHILAPNAYRTAHEWKSGTSFAAPLVAGVVARMLAKESTLTPVAVWERLRDTASLATQPIDSVTGNRRVVYRYGTQTCYPEFP